MYKYYLYWLLNSLSPTKDSLYSAASEQFFNENWSLTKKTAYPWIKQLKLIEQKHDIIMVLDLLQQLFSKINIVTLKCLKKA